MLNRRFYQAHSNSPGVSDRATFENKMLETRSLAHKVKVENVLLFFKDQGEKEIVRDALASQGKIKFEDIVGPFALLNMKRDDHFVLLVDDNALEYLNEEKFRKDNPNATVVLLTSNREVRLLSPGIAAEKYPYTKKADFVFSLRETGVAPSEIAKTLVRVVEDKKNLDGGHDAKRFIFLVIDDQPCWLSQFLPDLYNTIGNRADVITARTYGEAMDVIDSHGENIAAIITDIVFPKGEKQDHPSGLEIIEKVSKEYPGITLAVASQAATEYNIRIPDTLVIPKGKEGALDLLNEFLNDFAGLGDFVFVYWGEELGRASNIFELRDLIADKDTIPIEAIKEFGEKDFFSTWFYMHGYDEVGDKIRPQDFVGETTREYLLKVIDSEIEKIKEMPLVFEWDAGKGSREHRAIVVDSVKKLHEVLGNIPDRVVERYGEQDLVSLWLMRKGHSNLADELRQCKGTGSQIKKQAIEKIGNWLEARD